VKKDFATRKLCLKIRIQTADPPARKKKNSKKTEIPCKNQSNAS
jgi:hypothetical protein